MRFHKWKKNWVFIYLKKTGRNTTLTRFGIAIVPYMDLLMKLDIDVLEIDSPSYKRDFYIVWDDSVYIPPVVKDFKDFVCSK